MIQNIGLNYQTVLLSYRSHHKWCRDISNQKMADKIRDITSEETEEMDNNETAPVSPRGQLEKEATMAAMSDDDEVIITGVKHKEDVREGEFDEFTKGILQEGNTGIQSPPRHVFPPISPRGPGMEFHFPQDIRLRNGGVTTRENDDDRVTGNGLYNRPLVTRTQEQIELMEVQHTLHAQGSKIEVLRGTIHRLGNNMNSNQSEITIMNDAFVKITADNINAIRDIGERVVRVERGLESLHQQINVLRDMLETIQRNQYMVANASTEVNTSNGDGPESHRPSLRHGDTNDNRMGQENTLTTPAGRPLHSDFQVDTLPSLPGSGFRQLRYDEDLHSTARINEEIAHINRSLPHQSSSTARSRRTDARDLDQSTFSSSHGPKAPKFDGKGPFVPWLVQFRAVARAHGWDNSEKAVHLVAALEGSATGLLHGVTMVQMDNYDFLVERLKNRYDPVGRESTFRTQLANRTRRHGDTADEFAEAIALLAQRAHPNYEIGAGEDDPITSCIVDRFCAGQCNTELSSYLSLYPSRNLSDLIGACVRWEATVVKKSFKPADTVYAMKDTTPQSKTMTQEDMETFARQHGYTARPIARQDTYRYPEAPRQDTYRRQNDARVNTGGNRFPPRDKRQVLCWHCGTYGHFARECTSQDKSFRWAPPRRENDSRQQRNNRINAMDIEESHSDSPAFNSEGEVKV